MNITYAEAIRLATLHAMDRDPSVFVMGQGIATTGAHLGGGLWGTVPLDHPKRLLETPLSEEAMTGFALGAAQAGMRPILTHIRADFLHLAMNQLVNMAAKRQAWGNQLRHGVVVRAVIGRSWGQGAQHSQAPYAALVNVPGLNVVAPVTPQQAYEEMRSALWCDDPTIIFEHRLLHPIKGDVGFGDTKRERFLHHSERAQITLVGVSHAAVECLKASVLVDDTGFESDVIVAVDLAPLDMEHIVASFNRTGRLLVVDNGWQPCGIGAEIIARLITPRVDHGDIDIQRMGWQHTACPPTRAGERDFYPSAARIASRAWAMVTGEERTFAEDDTIDFKGPF